MIDEFKDLLNDLTEDEAVTLIYYIFPKYTEESLIKDKIEKNRLSTALRLYREKKISLQRTAEIAGISLEKLLEII